MKLPKRILLLLLALLLIPSAALAAPCTGAGQQAGEYLLRYLLQHSAPAAFARYWQQATPSQGETALPQNSTAMPQATRALAMPAATARPAQQSVALDMLEMINEDRTKAGLQPLQYNTALARGAMAHSRDMSANGFFSHTSPTQGGFAARARAAGSGAVAENIARYGSVAKAHAALLASAGHRANLMNPNYTQVGIGIVYREQDGGYYITQWFA